MFILPSLYGTIKSGVLDTQTVTVGFFAGGAYATENFYGYLGGSGITDGTSNIYSGATITNLYYYENASVIYWDISGSYTNTGWTTMKIGSTNFSRTSSTFSSGGGITSWTWNSITTNPFGSIGSNTIVTWT